MNGNGVTSSLEVVTSVFAFAFASILALCVGIGLSHGECVTILRNLRRGIF